MKEWYAVHVRSRHEMKVVERLESAGIETFLPLVEQVRRWSDRKRLVSFPLFPGYLFVLMDNSLERRLAVLKTKGVVRFLGLVPGEPEPVPEEQILSLKRLVDTKVPLDPHPYLRKGQRVRIRRGPLEGVEGILLERLGQHLLVLSVDVLQQGTSLRIDASEVESI